MSTMRLCVLAVVIAASLAAAQTPKQGCPARDGVSALFANTTRACDQQTVCQTAYTRCIGTGNTANCTLAAECISLNFLCLEAAAANTTGCPALNNLYLSIVQVTAGQLWNQSNAYKSCVASACRALNETFSGLGSNCTIDNGVLCQSPIVFVASLLFSGNFTGILNDPVKRKAFADAIGRDASKALGILGCIVTRMYIAGSKRQASQTLVVELKVPGVSSKNTAFAASFNALAANPGSFMTESSSVYTAATGQTLTVLKVGAGSSSAAFSAGQLSGTTAAPPTTARPPSPPTPAPFSGTTTSGAVAQSILAAAVAVLAAMLF